MAPSNKRQEILDTALQLITEHGFHDAPIATIAERAGVGAETIYRYFANKDVLITELSKELHDKICTELQQGYEVEKPVMDRFLHLSTAQLRYFIAHPLEFRSLEQYHNSPYGVTFPRDRILGRGEEGDLNRRFWKREWPSRLSRICRWSCSLPWPSGHC